jgi:hypothetical protein
MTPPRHRGPVDPSRVRPARTFPACLRAKRDAPGAFAAKPPTSETGDPTLACPTRTRTSGATARANRDVPRVFRRQDAKPPRSETGDPTLACPTRTRTSGGTARANHDDPRGWLTAKDAKIGRADQSVDDRCAVAEIARARATDKFVRSNRPTFADVSDPFFPLGVLGVLGGSKPLGRSVAPCTAARDEGAPIGLARCTRRIAERCEFDARRTTTPSRSSDLGVLGVLGGSKTLGWSRAPCTAARDKAAPIRLARCTWRIAERCVFDARHATRSSRSSDLGVLAAWRPTSDDRRALDSAHAPSDPSPAFNTSRATRPPRSSDLGVLGVLGGSKPPGRSGAPCSAPRDEPTDRSLAVLPRTT